MFEISTVLVGKKIIWSTGIYFDVTFSQVSL